jgi:hypothetical protein
MRYLKRAGWLALLALLIFYVAKHPGHADTLAHKAMNGFSQAADSASRFLDGL